MASYSTEWRPSRELHLTPQTLKQTPFTPLGRCPIGTPTTQIATKIAAHLPINTSATESLVKDCDGACRSLQSTLAGLALTVNALPPLYSMPPLFPMPSVPTAGAHSLEPPAPLPDFVGASGRSRSPVPLSPFPRHSRGAARRRDQPFRWCAAFGGCGSHRADAAQRHS